MRTARLALAVVASLSLVLAAAGTASASKTERHVNMLDDCDMATFNAAVGDGTCSKAGGVTFDEFIGQLIAQGQAPAWRFAPSRLSVPAGGSIEAYNRGGEAHSFTEVAHFGGGCIDALNQILGLSPVPECGDPSLFPGGLVPPGGDTDTASLPAGVHLFQCLIHPWMRATVTVK